MSKSSGNTVSPEQVIKQYGADILRLWVSQSDYTSDLRIGKEILKDPSLWLVGPPHMLCLLL